MTGNVSRAGIDDSACVGGEDGWPRRGVGDLERRVLRTAATR